MPHPFRRPRSRRTSAGLAAAVLLVGTAMAALPAVVSAAPPVPVPAGDPPQPAAPALAVPKISWKQCTGRGLADFQCARVEVPLDYDKPRGATTTIALTRLRATDPKRKIGTLFTNPGGPGGSGVDFVQEGAKTLYPAAVRARFDILGFDPRGVARSDPATCFRTPQEEAAALSAGQPFPLTAAQERAYASQAKALARSCARTSPTRFQHISTANVARDMDLLRRAVGDAKLTYAGYSYGTFLGATYAKLFPTKIRALVLDGTLDPREYSGTSDRYRGITVGARTEQTLGGSEVFSEFLRRCRAAGPDRCSLARLFTTPAGAVRYVLESLKREPVELVLPDGSELVLTYQVMVSITFSSLYSPTEWASLADLYAQLAAPRAAKASTAVKLTSSTAALVARARQDYASIGGSLGSTCVDTRSPSPAAAAKVADAEAKKYPYFGRYRSWIALPCHYLAFGIVDADAYRGAWKQTTSKQVLVVGTRWDPATPYKNTKPYAGLFRNASVLTLEGWGHTGLGKSACVDTRVARYLVNPRVDRPDATCRADVVPFAPTPAADAKQQRRPDVPPGVDRI